MEVQGEDSNIITYIIYKCFGGQNKIYICRYQMGRCSGVGQGSTHRDNIRNFLGHEITLREA